MIIITLNIMMVMIRTMINIMIIIILLIIILITITILLLLIIITVIIIISMCISFNYEYADDIWAPFLSELSNQCDFLLLQEHDLFMSQLDWFCGLGCGVSVHGVSGMDERRLVGGRTHSGAATLWRDNMQHYKSKRLCAVRDVLDELLALVTCVYMPCDDQRHDHYVHDYVNALSDIAVLSLDSDADSIIVGSDFNTDLRRGTPQTRVFMDFMSEYGCYCCDDDVLATVGVTYCSRINYSTTGGYFTL